MHVTGPRLHREPVPTARSGRPPAADPSSARGLTDPAGPRRRITPVPGADGRNEIKEEEDVGRPRPPCSGGKIPRQQRQIWASPVTTAANLYIARVLGRTSRKF